MKKSLRRKEVYFIAPNIFGIGGLQKHLYFILQAAAELVPDKDIRVFLKLDKESDRLSRKFPPNVSFYLSGEIPGFLRNICFTFRIFMHCLLNKPELLIVGHINYAPIARILKRITGVPYAVIAFGIESWGKKSASLSKGLREAGHIFSMSDFTRKSIASVHGVGLEKISLLPGSFDSDAFNISSKPEYLLNKYGLKENQPVILTVCRFDKSEQYKGYDKVIEALPEIIKTLPDVRYILVGSGNDMDRVRGIVSKYKLESHVILAGAFTGKELCDHYNLCDCFAMPSKQEGFGIVFVEAMACGKPVLAGNQDGSVDALNKGELGVLVDPDNVREIAQNLLRILKHEYPNPLIYEPQKLRQKAIEYFGFARFKESVEKYLSAFVK